MFVLVLVAFALQGASAGVTQSFHKRSPTPALSLNHPKLKRKADAGPYTPEQIRVSYAGPGAVTVSWVTWPQEDEDALNLAANTVGQASEYRRDREEGLRVSISRKLSMSLGHHRKRNLCDIIKAMDLEPVIQWGYEGGQSFPFERQGEYACYTDVAYDSGALNHVVIGDTRGPIKPGAIVYYRVGDKAKGVWSEQHQFKMAPRLGPQSLPYRIGLIGDLGQTEHSLATLDHVNAHAPDSIMLVGDLSYADGYQPRWDTWGRMVSDHTSRLVWMYTEGNHEIEASNRGDTPDFLAYTSRFTLPYQHSNSPSPLYYSYDVAGAHIIMLGSYAEYDENSEQYRWLINDLMKVNRRMSPWILVGMHAPWYNSNYNHQGEGEEMRKVMEPILYQHGVDAVISGHVHAYERSEHVYDYQVDECGPVHLNVGDGGNREGLDFDYYKQPAWSALREPSFGHGVIDLLDETHARFSWHRNQDGISEVSDSVMLVRDPKCRVNGKERLMRVNKER